jgi:hypothetical protein
MAEIKISYNDIRNKVARPATNVQKVSAKVILANLRAYIITSLS